jgi:hypothetical protein
MKKRNNHQVVQETDGTKYDGSSYHSTTVIQKNLSLEDAQALADSYTETCDSGLLTKWVVRGCQDEL